MVVRVAFFILMALGLLGFGTVAWLSTRPPPNEANVAAAPPPPPAPAKLMILVAAHPLRAGGLLKPEDLASVELSGDDALHGTPDTPDARRHLVGAMLRRSLAKNEILRAEDALKPGDHGFLSAVLEPGMRAVTIPMDAANGSVGLIWPGDRVDLILTQSATDTNTPLGRRIGAETVLTNARVIAIDQQLVQGGSLGGDGNQPKTVTLEVTADQAQRITVAMRLGQLSLAVRSAAGSDQAGEKGKKSATYARDVLPSMMTDAPAQATEQKIKIFNGTGEAKEVKF